MQIGPSTPLFIVSDLTASLRHYVDQLGFSCTYSSPEIDPFFALVMRDTAQFMLKVTETHVTPLPNAKQHAWAPWDAFVYVSDPEALSAELASRSVALKRPLGNTDDGLFGFEVADPDGYVCFFGRPQS